MAKVTWSAAGEQPRCFRLLPQRGLMVYNPRAPLPLGTTLLQPAPTLLTLEATPTLCFFQAFFTSKSAVSPLGRDTRIAYKFFFSGIKTYAHNCYIWNSRLICYPCQTYFPTEINSPVSVQCGQSLDTAT